MGSHDELLRKRELREEGIDPYAAEPDQDDIETTTLLIAGLAVHVRTTHQAYKDAIMENDKTAAELITKVLEAAQPALPALVGKIERRSLKAGGVQTSQEHHELRGVLLVDRFIERTLKHDGEVPAEGEYGGTGLYWLEDGRLAFGKRTGTWSRGPAALTGLETWLRPVEIDEAVKKFRVADVIKGLLEAIGKQGRLGELAEKVRAHTAKLATHLAAITADLG